MTLKLIASDLDATFLRADKTFNEPLFQQVLDIMAEKDMQFVVATGNHMQKVMAYFKNFTGQYQTIANNGAEVMLNGRVQNEKSVSPSALETIVRIAEGYHDHIFVGLAFTGQSQTFMLKSQAAIADTFKLASAYFQDIHLIDTLAEIDAPILKVSTVISDVEDQFMREVKQVLGNQVHVTTSGYGAVDIVNPEVNKANALTFIADSLDVLPEEIMAFGDGLNDLEMLEYVGHPVAMKNSDTELFKHDFDVTEDDNDHDGVLKKILSVIA